ncbi:MAG: FKBP-type peptidyl-prolyl cis-trans isomerase [Myxococcales bacterium FL481]|nr:MAG: FKBP-type peptidyl-prolyl cis-trans isomerase [Myxococcales bacterium FL481]
MLSVIGRVVCFAGWLPLIACHDRPQGIDAFAGAELRRSENESGLVVRVLSEGSGPAAADGDTLRVHYLLRLADGATIESSHEREPLVIMLGHDPNYIDGLHQGLVGARPGELREIIVPPALGYRGRAMAKIPPQAMLHFAVQIMAVAPGSTGVER